MKKYILIFLLLPVCLFSEAQVQRSKITMSKEQQLNEEYCSGLFKTTDGNILNIADDPTTQGYLNILYWLQGRIAGLSVYNSHTGVAVPYIRNQRATVYLDEIPVLFSLLNTIPTADIAMVKVIKGPFAGNMIYGVGGAIAVYTMKGGDEENE
ncbi:MAG: Plug domain-containing protein [Ferruginibacter sp.]